MNLVTLTQNNNNTTTMTSREIASVTGKEHRHVLVDIEKLYKDYQDMSLPKVGQSDYQADNGQTYRQFILTKEQTLDLITGYSRPLRIEINRRWAELEEQVANPVAAFKIPTYSEALRLAADQQDIIEAQKEQVLILENKVEEDKHKVRFFENTGNSQKLHSLTDAGSPHGISAQAVSRVLEEYNAFNMKNVTQKTYKIGFINQGLGEMKIRQSGHTQPMLTTKGCQWLDAKLYEDKGVTAIKDHYAKAKKLPTVYQKNLTATLNPVAPNTARIEHTQATINTINNLLNK